MKINQYNQPWPHYEVDKFLNKDDLKFIKDYTNYHIFYNKKNINTHGRYITLISKTDIVYSILKENFINLLNKIFNFNVEDFFFDTSLSICTPDFNKHHIHTDVANKKISAILFLSKQGNGTELYKLNSKSSLEKTVSWKSNKLFLFERTDYSWHNFNSIGNEEYRIVYNLNLNTTFNPPTGGNYLK